MKKFDTNQDRTSEYLKNFNRKKTIKLLIKEDKPVIFDVGANNGSSAIEFKKWWSNSIIHCFEPQEECWAELDSLEEQYNDKSIILNKYAVGNKYSNEKIFYKHNITSGQSGFNKINLSSSDSIYLDNLKDKKELEDYKKILNHESSVEVLRLDDYLYKNSIKNVNLLKIDTQGFEPEVLEGLGNSLSNIDVIITELMLYDYYERSLSFSDIEEYLNPAGFKLYDISHIAKNPMNGRTDWVDVIYVNTRNK